MKILARSSCSLLALMMVTSANATYEDDFTWRRWYDWVEGSVPGTSVGNAAPDQLGSPVWRYGVLTGTSLEGTNPWFRNTVQLMVWDDEWWGSNGAGVWARDYFGPGVDNNNANPPISQYTLWHDISARTNSFQYTSTVDWLNPVGDGAVLNISGRYTFQWQGAPTESSSSLPLEAVVAKYDASVNDYVVLWSGRYTNPSEGSELDETSTLSVPLTFVGVQFDEGDFLRFSLRSDAPMADPANWMGMRDEFVMRLVTVVPEPSTYMMFVFGLAAVGAFARGKSSKMHV
jgi:hypothetical protein